MGAVYVVPMNVFLLRLMLIATLVFNGFGAPWVIAQMAHEHAGHSGMAHADGMADAGAPMHAMHHMESSPSSKAHHDMARGDTSSGDCCDGATCQCGCVMPPILMFAAGPLVAQDIVALAQPALYERVSAADSTPPFRPPAV